LTVESADGGEASATLEGEGAYPPSAACEGIPADPVLTLDTVDWVGSSSSDPGGRAITTSWSLVSAPYGSAAVLPTATRPDLAGFVPDVAGTYVAELTVVDDAGLSSTCDATVAAVDGTPLAACTANPNPAAAIHDPVTWSAAGSTDPLGGALTY